MYSVSSRIKAVTQPRGGFLPISLFEKIIFNDGLSLGPENLHPSIIGLAVDYLTRYILTADREGAFRISLLGAANAHMQKKARKLLTKINNLDSNSIIAACKLAGFDVLYRSSSSSYVPVENIMPDESTISNIRTMVNRTLHAFDIYSEITKVGFDFHGAYTDIISTGDGDYLSDFYLWDMKVSKTRPSSKDTLQLLIYYLMGKRTEHKEFQTTEYIGFVNPRLNHIYRLEVNKIPPPVITTVSTDIIGYSKRTTTRRNTATRKIISRRRRKQKELESYYIASLFVGVILLVLYAIFFK